MSLGFTRDQALKALKETVSEERLFFDPIPPFLPLAPVIPRVTTLSERPTGCLATPTNWTPWKRRRRGLGPGRSVQMDQAVSDTHTPHKHCSSFHTHTHSLSHRISTPCVHQPHGHLHTMWPLRVSHQERRYVHTSASNKRDTTNFDGENV